jgi:retinoblastoma-like protein 1
MQVSEVAATSQLMPHVVAAVYVSDAPRVRSLMGSSSIARTRSVSLARLLSVGDVRLIDVFEPMRWLISYFHLGREAEAELKGLQLHYVVCSIVFEKYTRIASDLWIMDSTAGKEAANVYRFTWLLFLVAQSKLLVRPLDLIDAFYLLLACVDFALVHAPGTLLRKPLADLAAPTTLAALCQRYGAPLEDVHHMARTLLAPLIGALCGERAGRESILQFQPACLASDPTVLAAGTAYYGGLLDHANAGANVAAMDHEYELERVTASPDFDERDFIENPGNVGGSLAPSDARAAPAAIASPARTALGRSSSARSRMSPGRTPISTTQTAIAWLRDLSKANSSLAPSMGLQHLLNKCEADVEPTLRANVDQYVKLLTMIPPARIVYVKRLLWMLAERLTHAEWRRLRERIGPHSNPLARLLVRPAFAAALVALSAEVVTASYHNPSVFTALIRAFNVDAFHVFKLVEPVVRVLPTVPRVVVQRLASLEEAFLEVLAWRSPSFCQMMDRCSPLGRNAVRELIALVASAAATGASDQSSRATASATTMMTISMTDPVLHDELSSPELPAATSVADAAPAEPSSTSSTGATSTTSGSATSTASGTGSMAAPHMVFLRKLLHLVHLRTWDICMKLEMNQSMFAEVWAVLVLICTGSTWQLLRDRHLDTIILCTVYGVAKANQLTKKQAPEAPSFRGLVRVYEDVTRSWFTEIVTSSRSWKPSDAYRHVPLETRGAHGDIIKFYNEVFIPATERLLIKVHEQRTAYEVDKPVPGSVNRLLKRSIDANVQAFEGTVGELSGIRQSLVDLNDKINTPVVQPTPAPTAQGDSRAKKRLFSAVS